MAYDNKNFEGNRRSSEEIFSKKIRAGKRRTYFFDVKETRGNDYFITITESKRRFNDDGYERHKIFLYKEDFNKFVEALEETVDHVKTELLPDFDFDAFRHEDDDEYNSESVNEIEKDIVAKEEGNSIVDEGLANSDSVDSWKL